jgi:hypothetical protein
MAQREAPGLIGSSVRWAPFSFSKNPVSGDHFRQRTTMQAALLLAQVDQHQLAPPCVRLA